MKLHLRRLDQRRTPQVAGGTAQQEPPRSGHSLTFAAAIGCWPQGLACRFRAQGQIAARLQARHRLL